MITLILFALFIVAAIYLAFFCVFKIIWVLCKKERNLWPLILAGISSVVLIGFMALATWSIAKQMVQPFQPLIASVQNNPQKMFGPRTYRDTSYPFEFTIFDGMEFSQWISFPPIDVKLGIDTNFFKKPQEQEDSFLMGALVRYTQADEEKPFETLQQELSETTRQLEITKQEQRLINGLPAYFVQGIAYTNRGPIYGWMTAYQTAAHEVVYVLLLSLTEQDAPEVETTLQSFHLTAPQTVALENQAE